MRALLITVVTGVHVVVIGGALLIQGCGTTRGPVTLPTEHPMPSAVPESETVAPVQPLETYKPKSIEEAAAAASSMPAVKTPTPVPVAAESTQTYVVGKGDSLSVIAKRFGVSQADIMVLNNIRNPNVIRLGQKLKLPASADVSKTRPVSTSSASAAPAAPVAAASDGGYKVKSGDSLSGIAYRHGTTVKALKEVNNLKSDTIYVGQTLVLPDGAGKKPVATFPSPAPLAPGGKRQPVEIAPVAPELAMPDLSLPPERPPVAAGSRTTHTVKVGETILTVSSEYNVSISKLRKTNNLTTDTLVPGQVLVIPSAD